MVMASDYDTPTDARYGRTYLADGRKANKRAKPDEIDLGDLTQAMRASRRALRAFREERVAAVREFVGRHWSENGADHRVPVNLLAKYVKVMSRALVPKCPRVMLSTRSKPNQPAVAAMQQWVNQRLVQMHFDQTLRRWVIDSLFCLGILKVALGTPADSAVGGYVSPAGVPFIECVDVDDFAFDLGCKDFRQASWIAHRYHLPLSVALELKYFDAKERKKLVAYSRPDDGRINPDDGDDRITTLGQTWQSGDERHFERQVEIWEVYLPRHKKIITLPSDHGGVPVAGCEPLRIQEWLGPDCGPYHFLSLMPVPGNAMPAAPIQNIIDLHYFVNHGYRKLVNQMQRQKEVLPVRGGAVDDAKNLVQANDGEAFACDNADAIKAVSYGGPNPVNANFTIHLTEMFNKQAGNLDLLDGSAPQSKTATQDKILAANATGGVADMQDTTTAGIASVLDSFCWFWWYHPQQVMEVGYTAPGVDNVGITRKLYPGTAQDQFGNKPQLRRAGRYEDLMCRVDPYSLVFRTPQERLQFLFMIFDKMVPLAPMLQQQGVQIDVQFFLKKVSEYADEPDIIDMFTIAEPPQQPQGPQGPQGQGAGLMDQRMPASTSREYTRRSEASPANQQAADFANSASEWGAENQ